MHHFINVSGTFNVVILPYHTPTRVGNFTVTAIEVPKYELNNLRTSTIFINCFSQLVASPVPLFLCFNFPDKRSFMQVICGCLLESKKIHVCRMKKLVRFTSIHRKYTHCLSHRLARTRYFMCVFYL